MAKFNQDLPQFGSAKPANTGGSQHCVECELMLTDAVDGTLSAEEQARFDNHMAGCVSCMQMLAEARRGAAWLEMLRMPAPEPPAALLERILAQTSGLVAPVAPAGSLSILPVASTNVPALFPAEDGSGPARMATVLPFPKRVVAALHLRAIGHTMLQPRLAMTAAMAFFSIGLTLNLTGVRLNEIRASDLKPSSVKRSFYQANAHVVRYVDNLRAVYELESRVRDLQRSSDNDPPPQDTEKKSGDGSSGGSKSGQPEPKESRPRPGPGTSRRQGSGDTIDMAPVRVAELLAPEQESFINAVSARTTLQEGESA